MGEGLKLGKRGRVRGGEWLRVEKGIGLEVGERV